MANILIIYSTVDGHTLAISQHIADTLLARGNRVSLASAEQWSAAALNNCDKVVIGASVRYGSYRPELMTFVRQQEDVLGRKPSAFFTVNLVARKPGRNSPETNPYVRKLLCKTTWRPDQVAVFAGKLDYPRYRFLDRWIIRVIMWLSSGPTAFTTVRDFTDWKKVDAFAARIGSLQHTHALNP